MSSEETHCEGVLTKKRTKTGRMQEVMKKMKLSSHEAGESCHCKRLKCFENITESERKQLLSTFNAMSDNNEENAYLCSLISLMVIQRRRNRNPEEEAAYNLCSLISLMVIQRRRNRNPEEEAAYHDSTYSYRVRIKRDNKVVEIPVCYKAFLSIHGVTKGKVEYLQKSLKETGLAPKDKRGKHCALTNKLPDDSYKKVYDHINSFKGRLSHYSLHDSKKLYLPEELNVKKMYSMLKEIHPSVKISYDTYRTVFNTKFNISFGYPRTDT
ncbi:hypothetical protein QE152_g38738 [Popillia japonica]|uniref:Uncharacterized protein n=1 Tax=Popillia japonica TaxID=7064 RepID=A0AAW1HWH1_POPJA